MKLMVIIVQERDYERLSRELIRNRILATKFSTEGLYLNKKNVTLMACVEDEQVEQVIGYIQNSCTERTEERQVSEYNGKTLVDVLRSIKVGGATVFLLEVNSILKF